jgi:hypothetical protein
MPNLTTKEMGIALEGEDAIDSVDAPVERGSWKYVEDLTLSNREQRYFLESDDFTHDVRLSISGDFANDQQRRRYGEMIAGRLNGTPAATEVEALTASTPESAL